MAYSMRGGIGYAEAGIDRDRQTRELTATRVTPPMTLSIPIGTTYRFGDHSSSSSGSGCSDGNNDGVRQALTVAVHVRVGDRVLRGQKLATVRRKGDAKDHGVPVHAPEAGFISNVGETIELQCDGTDEDAASVTKVMKRLADCGTEEIIEKIRACGIVDGDGVPVADKLESAVGKAAVCIVNAVDDMAACAKAAGIVNGLKIVLRALGVRQGVIVAGSDVIEVVKKLSAVCKRTKLVKLELVRAKYPQGSARRLTAAVTGRELRAGDDPISLGCVVLDAQTCVAIYDAFVTGMPQVRRIVTICGDGISESKNIEVPLGVRLSELPSLAGVDVAGDIKSIDADGSNEDDGGNESEYVTVIDGDVMSGRYAGNDEVVGKTTRTVTFMRQPGRDHGAYTEPPVCIRCGRCARTCPERLMPHYIYNYIRDGKSSSAIARGAFACVGCGICTYICPGGVDVKAAIAEFVRAHKEGGS